MVAPTRLLEENASLLLRRWPSLVRKVHLLVSYPHVHEEGKTDNMNGGHVCQHSNSILSVSTDQFGEQTYIRRGKCPGGLKSISTSKEQVAQWVECYPVLAFLSDAFDDMYQVPDDQRQNKPTPESKHKEEGIKRQKSDDADRKKMEEKLRSLTHPLEQSTQVFNLVNGRMATPDINVQDCKDIGEEMLKKFAEGFPTSFHATISRQVKTMTALKRKLVINGHEVYEMETVSYAFSWLVSREESACLTHSVMKWDLSHHV